MDPRTSVVTLAVRDLAASRRFYLDGLGWPAAVDVPGEVVMVQVGEHVVPTVTGSDDRPARVRRECRYSRRGPIPVQPRQE